MSELTNEERAAIHAFKTALELPRDLEGRTMDALRQKGLVRPSLRKYWLLTAAAFVFGIVAGAAAFTPQSPGYVLVLSGGSATGNETAGRVDEYARWAAELRREGVTISGQRLTDDARRFEGDAVVPSNMRGYFLFGADSEEHAEEIAATCPHLIYGGAVTLGRIDP